MVKQEQLSEQDLKQLRQLLEDTEAVSYTHLDVYKRQVKGMPYLKEPIIFYPVDIKTFCF